ncbi:MAG: hypothetical protein GEV11_22590, partial [Streptosporangiales bacterium]|nr:hypothetical protein [Streptosporangiales bacterium]
MRRIRAGLAGLACAGLLSSGCAAIEDTFAPRPTATPTPAAASPASAGAAITAAEARRVAAAYAQAYNRAAARLDGDALTGIETGPLLFGHQAELTIRKKAGRPAAALRALPDVSVPREAGDGKWFVAPMATTAPATRRLVLFEWDGAGSWKAVSDTVADLAVARALRGRLTPRDPGAAVPATA